MSQAANKSGADQNGPISVWITNLCWPALPALVGTFLRHGRFTLRFTAATRSGLAIAWLLRVMGFLASAAQRVEFTGHGAHVDDQGSARFRIHARVNEFTDWFFMTHRGLLEGLAYPDPRVRSDRVLTNLRKAAATTTYELLAFLEFARYQHRIEGMPTRRLVIMSPAAVLANSIPPGWDGQDVEFVCLRSRHHSLLLRLGRGILRCVSGSVRRRRPRLEMTSSIGVAAVWGLDRSARLNDLFWWWDSGIPAERVVLYFDRADHPASREVVSHAEQLGIRCVVLNRRAVGDSPHLLWRAAPGPFVSICRLWRNLQVCGWSTPRGAVGRWVACRVLEMLYSSEQLEDFLTEFNVRGLFHYQDSGLDYLSLACDAAGAARIGHHWSDLHWPAAYHARLHQVYFTWGPRHVGILDAAGSCVDHVLLSGCVVQGAYPGGSDGRSGIQHRDLVTGHGASRVLALFDTSLPCEGFYEFFLRRAIQNPRWGLLIKPKSVGDLPWVRQRLPELQSLYEQALVTGRVRMLDWQTSPAEAAASADFAVSVDINSATTIAALAGHRAIHLDYVRLHDSPLSDWANFHRAGPDRLVFDDPENLWERLNRYFDEPGCDPALGAVDDMLLREIDPFRDGQAGQRIGEYLRWYLDGLDQRLGRDVALSKADCRYADTWGTDKVVHGLMEAPEPVGSGRGPGSQHKAEGAAQ